MRILQIILVLLTSLRGTAQELAHPLDGALLPTRASLMRIATETWEGLPKGYRLPAQVDLRAQLPPPGDQGKQNSCIAWAVAYGIGSYQQAVRTGIAPVDSSGSMDPARTFSPAYPFNLTKTEFDTTDSRCLGSNFDKVFSVLLQQGCCTWQDLPYDPAPLGCFQPVPEKMMRAADRKVMTAPMRVSPYELDQIRSHLAQGTPVAFAMGIDTAFKNGGKRAARGAPFDWRPECAQAMPGSHAMLAVGYTDADSTFLIMNSWGTNWGEGGFWHMRYEVFDCHVTEAYIARPPLSEFVEVPLEQEPAKRTERNRMKAKLKLGERVEMQGLSLALTAHAPGSDRARLVLRDSTLEQGVELLDLREDSPVRFFHGDELVKVTYTKASRTHDVRRSRAHIVAVVEEGTDPCVERAIRLSDRIRSARVSPR